MSVRSKLREQYRYANTISGRKLSSIKKYTDAAYASINKSLLQGTGLSKKCKEIVDDLDNIFKNVPPLEDDIVVYRGITKKHDFGILSGFISTSYNQGTAVGFADKQKQCCVLVINVPAGAKVLPVEDLSLNPREGEILLPRSGYFVTTGSTFRSGMETFYLDLYLTPPLKTPPAKTPPASPTDDQIVDTLVSSVSPAELEILGPEVLIRDMALSLEKSGVKVREELIKRAMSRFEN